MMWKRGASESDHVLPSKTGFVGKHKHALFTMDVLLNGLLAYQLKKSFSCCVVTRSTLLLSTMHTSLKTLKILFFWSFSSSSNAHLSENFHHQNQYNIFLACLADID